MYGCPDFSENAWEAASDLFDFTLCRRPNGSFYGTAGRCRKGVEAEHDETEVSRKDLLQQYAKTLGLKGIKLKVSDGDANFAKLNDEDFARVLQTTTHILTDTPGKRIDVMNIGEFRALKKNAKMLKSLEKDLKPLEDRLRKVSDDELNATWALLPLELQSKFKGAGVNNKNALQEDGTLGGYNVWRGKETLRRFLAQNGRDPFTGLKLSIYNAELEHIKGVEQYGSKIAENPNNWVWIRQGVNRQKGEKNLEQFITSIEKLSEKQVHEKYLKARAKQTVAAGLDEKRDAQMLAQAGYNIYMKWPENKLPKLMTQLGIKNRYVETMENGRTAGRPALQNKMPRFTDPNGKKVSAQAWIVLNWGNWNQEQRGAVTEYINTQIFPALNSGRMTKEEVTNNMAKFFTKIQNGERTGRSTPKPSSIRPTFSKPDELDALLASIRNS